MQTDNPPTAAECLEALETFAACVRRIRADIDSIRDPITRQEARRQYVCQLKAMNRGFTIAIWKARFRQAIHAIVRPFHQLRTSPQPGDSAADPRQSTTAAKE